jgi:hypothetical protein
MANANPTGPLDRATRRATVRRLATEGKSNRAIARQLGVGKDTVARDLAATPAPPAPGTAPQDATPPATSGAPFTPPIVYRLDPRTVQDLNVLADPRTGALPAPLLRAIRAAADHRRAQWLKDLERLDQAAG